MCKGPTDWTLLALQNERSGRSHYVVACRCPEWAKLEGPYTHNYPPYARIPGIKVYGMLCAQVKRLGKQKGKLSSRGKLFFLFSFEKKLLTFSFFPENR